MSDIEDTKPFQSSDTIAKSPQQLGQACQVDNCENPAVIWIAIKGDLVYSDDARDMHFNLWVCHTHYEELASSLEPLKDSDAPF